MALRDLHSDLRAALLREDAFVYAHLVKFERPLSMTGSTPRHSGDDFVYVTDGSFDIVYNDGSVDVDGTANGNQLYVANKITRVSAVSETIEARATNFSIQMDAAALDTSLTDSYTITSSTVTSSEDLVAAGFREGDIVEFVGTTGSNKNKKVKIESFSTNNTVANINTLTDNTITNEVRSYTLTVKNPEIEGILSDRSGLGYARYINRDVIVYKAFINPNTGAIIGEPYLLFKGIIAGGKVSEDPTKRSIVSWNITSHWGDFSRVQGRITSDPYHRALDQNNKADPEAAIRPAYASDLGFLHSEQAINLIAIYQVKETKQELKMKRKWYGSKKYKLVEYEVEVDREADLRFNLQAKYLPVVYGVNKIDSIPVFVDTLNSDAREVFVAYAICEGRIGGLYDIYFDDVSSICIDENDKDTRSTQTAENTVDVLCQGRADRGDVLTGQTINSATTAVADPSAYSYGSDTWAEENRSGAEVYGRQYNYFTPVARNNISEGASSNAAGITHEKGTKFSKPIDSVLTFHAGLPNQKANSTLLANANNFKVATDYYSGSDPYWGAQHQLLDTAYSVVNYTIGEGETTIPKLHFVVRGKGINCYNYDFSYASDPTYSENLSSFNIGQTVTLKSTSGNVTLATAVIADIYTTVNVEGVSETRVRFTSKPDITVVTQFYMTDGSNNHYLVTYNHEATSGTVPSALQEEITSVANTSTSGGSGIDVTVGNGNPSSDVSYALANSEYVSILDEIAAEHGFIRGNIHQYLPSGYNPSTGVVQNLGNTQTNSSEVVTEYVTVLDGIKLATSAGTTNDAYNNLFIEVTHTYSDGSTFVQTRKIKDYDGSTKVAMVYEPFEQAPGPNDTYKIYSTTPDTRVSTNPAMQLLDYLTDDRYGRALNKDRDLDMESFFTAARKCDTRSNVFMLLTSQPTDNDIYKYTNTSSGKTLWQGKVLNSTTRTISGTTYYLTEFSEVLGKLLHRWENWKYFYTGELYYKDGILHKASADGNISSYSNSQNVQSSLSLTKVNTSSNPAETIAVDISSSRKTFEGDPVIKKVEAGGQVNHGYSLYDADDIKYWRYLGWEAQNQRHVTRHQTNAIIDTSAPVFDNINSMLKHFNGILRYSAGKYSLDVMETAGSATSVTVDGETYVVENIDESDIIGSIDIEDAGQKGTYNQVSVSINDPQNRFEGRSVMMFNSDYLKEDRMVPKKGNFQAPYVTNYFNARINAKQYLDQSRSGLKINFTMGPKGALLLAGEVIRITYPRFGWSNKLYRIVNLTFKEDCLVQVTAEEHDDSTYLIGATNRGAISSVEGIAANQGALSPPQGLSASSTSDNHSGGIQLTITNSNNFNPASHSTQIWASSDNDRSNAVLLDTTKTTSYIDPIIEGGGGSKYYWVRHVASVVSQAGSQTGPREIFSDFHPTSSTGGQLGVAADSRAQRVDLTFSQGVISYAADGTTPDVSSITLTAKTQGFTDPHFEFSGGGSAFSNDTGYSDSDEAATDTEVRTFTVPTSYSASPYNFTVNVKEGGTGDILASDTGSVASVKSGSSTITIYLDNPSHVVNASSAGVVSSFGNAGTNIRVFEGANELDYDGSGSTAGHWTVTASGSGITPDSISEDGDSANLGNSPSNMTGDNATITLAVSGKRLDGTSFSQNALQSISKARNGVNGTSARVVSLRASTFAIPYASSGGSPGVSSITLTADASNFDDPYFLFEWDGTDSVNTFQDETTYGDGNINSGRTKTATFTPPSTYSSTPFTFTVSVKESGSGDILASDTLTIFSIKPGADNKQLVVSTSASNYVVPTSGSIAPATIEFTANKVNLSGTPTWSSSAALFSSASSTSALSGSGLTRNNVFIKTFGLTNVQSVSCTATLTEDGTTFTDTETVERLVDASNVITASLSNDNTTLSASNQGAVSSYNGSNQIIEVFEGTTRLDWDNAGTTAGHYTVATSTTPANLATIPTPSAYLGGDNVSWGNLSNIASTTTSFTVNYAITGKKLNGDTFSLTKSMPVNIVTNGDDALTVILTNPAHTIPVTLAGTLDYTGSGTTIKVFEGTTPLDYDNAGSTAGHWTVSASGTGITAGSPSDSSNDAVYSVASSLSGDTGSIDFTITGKRQDGTAFSIVQTQTFAKANRGISGTNAKVVNLRAARQVIAYDEQGANPDVSSITLTAESKNFTNAFFKFTGGDSNFGESTWSDGSGANEDTIDFTVPAAYSATPYTFTVSVKEGSASGDVVATDTITIASIKPGAGALTAVLSNEAHAIPQTKDGTVTLTGSGTNIQLFEGATPLDYDGLGNTAGHWRVSNLSESTVTTPTSGRFTDNGNTVDVAAISNFSAGNAGSRTFTLSGKRLDGTAFTLTKSQRFVRTIDGSDGVDGVTLIPSASHVAFNKDGSTYDPASTSTVTLSAVGATITAVTWSVQPANSYLTLSGTGNSGCTVTFSNDRTAAQINGTNTVTAVVTGTTSDGATNQSLGTVVIPIPTSINGSDGVGTNGLRTIQGYLYYEKSQTPGTAPTTTGIGNEYTFSTGLVGGTGIGTNVDQWTNAPRTQDPTSANVHYTVRYYGTESSANSNTINVSYSGVVQHTNFSGVVTFNNGTGRFEEGGTAVTTIDGGSIDTGTIQADRLTIGNVGIGTGAGEVQSALKLYSDALKIFDSGNLRVKIGNLSNDTDE